MDRLIFLRTAFAATIILSVVLFSVAFLSSSSSSSPSDSLASLIEVDLEGIDSQNASENLKKIAALEALVESQRKKEEHSLESLSRLNNELNLLKTQAEELRTQLKQSEDDQKQRCANATPPPPTLPPVTVNGASTVSHLAPKRKLLPCPRESGKLVTMTNIEGGLGDRFKGMVNAFIVAQLSGRGLFIQPSLLIDTSSTITQGVCRWSAYAPFSSDPWYIRVINARNEIFSEVDFKSHDSQAVWDVHSNMPFGDEVVMNPQFKDSPLQPELYKSHREGKLFHQVLRSMIQPSPSLEQLLTDDLKKRDPEGKYYLIGIHIRAGDHKIGVKRKRDDQYRFTHPHDYRMAPEESFPCFVQEGIVMWDEIPAEEQKKYPGGPLFFISSDYPSGGRQIIDMFAEKGYPAFEVSNLAGNVKHIFYNPGDQSRTYVDWWMLTRCQKIVLTISGYSETASKYSCVPVSFFVNQPSLKQHNNFAPDKCVHHFIRMRGDGLCSPEMDDDPLYEYTYYRYN